ncbi:hypothetical protein K435DRAFT_873901 [Dendrothele bispora CBS 962.96]|uniref:Uncharacterized protein n=1 Tax=Dendrothele bispora (strain CBS 962.96) TaxID=1314807 RepID=A0A4S8KXZ2_DENBC|nr:hypothetical protein K435DRAFT_873901 [Dendrothele bispora CBS 962.96]
MSSHFRGNVPRDPERVGETTGARRDNAQASCLLLLYDPSLRVYRAPPDNSPSYIPNNILAVKSHPFIPPWCSVNSWTWYDARHGGSLSVECFDVIVVGGSVAGCSTALSLIRQKPDAPVPVFNNADASHFKVGTALSEDIQQVFHT